MSPSSRPLPPILLGFTVLALVIAVDQGGGFDGIERESVDWRLSSTWRPWRPMSDQIVHVDIDDGAIDSVGRWPWDRAVQAKVLDELERGGARTVALDIIFSDPQKPTKAADGSIVDHDARLAEALGKLHTVLGVTVSGQSIFGEDWSSPEGAAQLERLFSILKANIHVDAADAARESGLDAPRLNRFLSRSLEFKKAAAWQALQWMDPQPTSLREFENRLSTEDSELVGTTPESVPLELLWNQYLAWKAIRPLLLPSASVGTHNDRAPLPPSLSAAAAAVGFVTADIHTDPDGETRSVVPVVSTQGGSAVQFGLAAAASHLGVPPAEIHIDHDQVRIRDRVLPLHEGKLWIDWPSSSSDPRWYMLRQHRDDAYDSGHVSAGALAAVADARETLRRGERNFAAVTRAILDYAGEAYEPGEEVTPDKIAAARSEVEFTVDPPPADLAGESEAFQAHYHNCRLWLAAEEALQHGRPKLAELEATVRSLVEGKLVFIGIIATGAYADFVPTAMDGDTPGVVVNAAVANMVLTGRELHFSRVWRWLILAVLGSSCAYFAHRFNELTSLLAALGLLSLYVGIFGVWRLAGHNEIYPMAAPLFAGGGAWLATAALDAALEARARKQITLQFRSRVSDQLVDHLVKHPDALTMGGQEREATVFFCDIAGFTTISERLGGDISVKVLNRFLGALTKVLIRHDAYVNKFLGDGIMAFWSAFVPDPNQATSGCLAARDCIYEMKWLNEHPIWVEESNLSIRIGLTTGHVIVGDCGAPPALNDYTVIGDAVNLAARLESANKAFGTSILINGRTRELIDDSLVRTRFIGNIVVVGQSIPVPVYEVVGRTMPEELLELTTRAATAYTERRFEDSATLWREMQERFGDSKLATAFLENITEGEDTDGAMRLRSK